MYSYATGYCLPYFHPFPFTYGCETHEDKLNRNKAQWDSMVRLAPLGNVNSPSQKVLQYLYN